MGSSALLVGVARRDGAPDPAARKVINWALAAICAAALVVSAVQLWRTPIEVSLARVPARRVTRANLTIDAPAYWVVEPKAGPLALRDPLVGLVRPVALLVEIPGRLEDESLAAHAQRMLQRSVEGWRRSKKVHDVRAADGQLREKNVISKRLYYRFAGFRFVRVHIYKQQKDLVIRALVNLRVEHLAAYKGTLQRMARSLSFDDR